MVQFVSSSGSCRDRFVGCDAVAEVVECGSAEAPVEGDRRSAIAVLESYEPVLEGGEVREVLRFDDFALNDGEVNFDLIQSGCVHG